MEYFVTIKVAIQQGGCNKVDKTGKSPGTDSNLQLATIHQCCLCGKTLEGRSEVICVFPGGLLPCCEDIIWGEWCQGSYVANECGFFYMLGYVVLVQIRESLCVIRSEEAPGPNFKCHNFGMILFHISFKMSIFVRLILVLFVNITFKWASQLIYHRHLFFFCQYLLCQDLKWWQSCLEVWYCR